MTEQSETPRTDAAAHGFCQANPEKTALDMWQIECVDASFARELERELAALRRGEYICKRCGLRKDGEHEKADF